MGPALFSIMHPTQDFTHRLAFKESRVQGRDTEDAPEMGWVCLQVCETFTLIVWGKYLNLFGGWGLFFSSVNSR